MKDYLSTWRPGRAEDTTLKDYQVEVRTRSGERKEMAASSVKPGDKILGGATAHG